MENSLTGVILAGGFSTRFGSNKALAVLPGKETLLERTARILGSVHCVKNIAVSCRDDQVSVFHAINPDWEIIVDDFHDAKNSPIFGVIKALSTLQHAVLVLSCDLPFIDFDTLSRLADAHFHASREKNFRTAYMQQNGYIEPLVAIYDVAALPFLIHSVQQNCLSLFQSIPKEFQTFLPIDNETSFFNMNTAKDMEFIYQTF